MDFDGAAHRLDRACELGDHTVAGSTEHTAAVAGDQPINDLAIGPEPVECRSLSLLAHPQVIFAIEVEQDDAKVRRVATVVVSDPELVDLGVLVIVG